MNRFVIDLIRERPDDRRLVCTAGDEAAVPRVPASIHHLVLVSAHGDGLPLLGDVPLEVGQDQAAVVPG